jgi:hypothetical protein
MRVSFSGVSYKVKNDSCADVINPADPVPETMKFGSELRNKLRSRVSFLAVSSVSHVRALLEGDALSIVHDRKGPNSV